MKYEDYEVELRHALLAFKHLMESPAWTTSDGKKVIDAPSPVFWDTVRRAGKEILTDIPKIAKHLEMLALENRLAELKKELK